MRRTTNTFQTNSSTGKQETKPFHFGNTSLQVSNLETSIHLGSCAGIAEHCSMFPMDTIKVRVLQRAYYLLDSHASKWQKTFPKKCVEHPLSGRGHTQILERLARYGFRLYSISRQLLLSLRTAKNILLGSE